MEKIKKAIVIGASSGIGFQLATILAKNNYRVGISARRATLLKSLMESNPQNFICSAFDCTEENNTTKLEELVVKMEGLDLLVFCAGTGDLNGRLEYGIENVTNQLNVNAFAEIAVWGYNFFEKQGKGHLVVISSIAGIRGNHLAPAYNASKAYQINYLEGLRQKAKKTKKPIYITDVRPGFVDTDMAKGEGLFWVASSVKAANQMYGIIKRKKDIGYVTKRWRTVAILLRILPNSIYKRM